MVRSRRWALWGGWMLLLVLDTAAADPAAAEQDWLRLGAEVLVAETARPPHSGGWQPVSLPDLEGVRTRGFNAAKMHARFDLDTAYQPSPLGQGKGVTQSAWYRFKMPDIAPTEPWSLYLWRFSMNVEAYFNDELVGSGGVFGDPMTRNWNRPFLFSIPASAWRDADNYLYVRLGIYSGWGVLTPPAIGPTAVLAPEYENRFFRQITLSQSCLVLVLVLCVIALAFSLVQPRETVYLIYAAAAFLWSIYCLNNFWQDVPFTGKTWWWLVHVAVDGFSVCLVCIAHRLLGVVRPRVEGLLAGVAAAGAVCYAAWPLPDLARFNSLVHVTVMLGPVYVTLWVAWCAIAQRRRGAIAVGASFALLLVLGAHDLLLNSLARSDLWTHQFFLLQLGAPVMLVVLLLHLARRFTAAVSASHAVAQHIENAVVTERERIYQDLHDDVGAKLLSLVYGSSTAEQAGLARGALRDIRSIVSGDRPEGRALDAAAMGWRDEITGRCAKAGFEFDWHAAVDATWLAAPTRCHLERVLRELTSNALEHSGGTRLTVALRRGRDFLEVIVDDDGAGLTPNDCLVSRGLSGVRRRLETLGGAVAWEQRVPMGARCRLSVPLPLRWGRSVA